MPEEPTRIAVAPKPEPLKLAEAPKVKVEPARNVEAKKEREAARIQLASASPTAPAEDEPKSGSKFGDMARRAKNAILSIASGERQSMTEKLWGKSGPRNPVLAYASADAGSVTGSIAPREQNPMLGGSPPYDRDTAVYDITAHTVYLPDGTKLEAHSGLGPSLDDPHSSRIRMRGVTPPHIYTLKPREALFHGVAALRLTPVGGEECDLRPRRSAGAHLHARSERRFQRLRLVPRLQRLPRRLSQPGHPQARGPRAGGLRVPALSLT